MAHSDILSPTKIHHANSIQKLQKNGHCDSFSLLAHNELFSRDYEEKRPGDNEKNNILVQT